MEENFDSISEECIESWKQVRLELSEIIQGVGRVFEHLDKIMLCEDKMRSKSTATIKNTNEIVKKYNEILIGSGKEVKELLEIIESKSNPEGKSSGKNTKNTP